MTAPWSSSLLAALAFSAMSLTGCGSAPATPSAVKDVPNFYALTCIANATSGYVQAKYGWNGFNWTNLTIAPGDKLSFYWRYSYPNQNTSPLFLLVLEMGNEQPYKAVATSSPDTNCSHATVATIRNSGGNFYVDGGNVSYGTP